MSTPITTTGTYQFKNRTNGDILIRRVYFDDKTYFSIDTDSLIPGGAKKNALTLGNQISKTSNSTGEFTWLVGNTNGGYNQAKYSTTSHFPGWVQQDDGWPLMGWSPSGSNWMMHPQRNDGDFGTSHYTCILRWVAKTDGMVSVRSKIEHRGGGFGGVHGMVVHCMRGSSKSKPSPTSYNDSGKTYINSLNWNAVSGVGYTRQAFGDVLGSGGPVQANLISNWNPRKKLSNSSGGIMSPEQKRATAGSDWSKVHTSLIQGNTDKNGLVTTEVRGPHYAFGGGQGGYEPLKCRYIRWFPMRWYYHPTARVGAYNNTEKWALGTNATLTSNSIWANRADHSPTYAHLNDTRAHSNWSALDGHNNAGQEGAAYIQQDFGSVKEVTHIASQGRHNYDQWVTQWMIFASQDGTNWSHVSENSGGNWNPDYFTKEVTIKAGDWIDMIVEAGDVSSAYDSTKIDHNITYIATGTGDHADQYIDELGWIRNTATDSVDGIELQHNEHISIPVNSPHTTTSLNGHSISTHGSNLKVDYKCDKLLDSGSSTAFFDAISPETHEVKSLTAANWFKIISKATGKSMTMYIPSQMLAGKGLRWVFSVDFGWIYISPKLNPFDSSGCWIYKSQSSAVGSQSRGWMWMVLDDLPRIYAHTGPHKWFMVGKTGSQSYLSPCWIYSEHVQTSQTVNQLRYRYKIYPDFLNSGWGNPVEKSYISTGPSTDRDDSNIVLKIPPDHTRAGVELGFGASDDAWWKTTSTPTPDAIEISKSAMYRVYKTANMPLSKMWYEPATSGTDPETVAFMCRENGSGGDWIVMYGYKNWSDRVNQFSVWKSLDGKHTMQLEGSNNSNLYWTITTNGQKYVYRPGVGMSKVEMVFNGNNVYADKFPADGSYCYRNKIAGISHGGKWVPVPGTSHETMLYFIYHKPNERSKFTKSFSEVPGSPATSLGLEMTGRPDIRGRDVNGSSFGYLRAFDYDFTALNDSIGPDRSSNSRLILFLTNCKSDGSSTVDTTPVMVRETHATIDCSAATTTSGGQMLKPGGYMRCKTIYPGYNSATYRESVLFGVGKTPVPELNVDVYPEGQHFNQNGYVVAAAKYQSPTTGYMDCGYDTKNLARITGNGYTEIVGNLPPEQTGGPTKSGQAWLGLNIENGNSKNAGTILYNGEKLKASAYNISMFNYGDQDNYTWINNMSQHLDIQIPVHRIGHLGAKFMAYGNQNGGGADSNHTLLYGGNEQFGSWNTSNQCCDSNGFNVTNDRNCLDYKTPVLNDPAQIMYREGRKSGWDVINVRYIDDFAYKSGPIQFRADSGPYQGSYSSGRWSWRWKTSYRDTKGPTRLKFHNWHPYSSVWVNVRARIAWASDDAAGLTIGAWSDKRGKIFDPFDHNSAYLYCSWDNYGMWPHTFSGGDFGAVSPGSGTGVHNFVGGRNGNSSVINDSNGTGVTNVTTKSFGYFRILAGETITFALYGACNISCHNGYGQLEGTMANWFRLDPHSWPEDPD